MISTTLSWIDRYSMRSVADVPAVAVVGRVHERGGADMSAPSTTARIDSLGAPPEPALPEGFGETFESVVVTTSRLRQHAVIGGRGPALLLVNGWPQTWYAWRYVLPTLAEHFTVVAAEPRGSGRSDKPAEGYDTGSMGEDLVALMDALGYERFAVLGHDVGMWIGYALAADHPTRVTRLAVAEAAIPGVSAEPSLFGPSAANARLFHFAFNRLDGINEELVRGREDIYFGHQFTAKTAAGTALEPHAVKLYLAALTEDPDGLRGSFGPYRALEETMRQNERRRRDPLPMPVLALGGDESIAASAGATMAAVAGDVQSRVLDGCGHFPAEERPAAFLCAVMPFLRERS
jgi:pimeloyl-ACP methyl ester carboxylesterase